MSDLPDDEPTDAMTRHAQTRAADRELKPEAIELLRIQGDLLLRSRDACLRVRMSRRAAKRLDRERAYRRQTIESAREMELVLSNDRRRVITGWRLPPDLRFRRSGARPNIQRTWRFGDTWS